MKETRNSDFADNDFFRGQGILVSPHPDDIALSIGGIIAKGFFQRPVLGVTIFSRSAISPYGQYGLSPYFKSLFFKRSRRLKRLADSLARMEISRCRKIEDLHFFRSVGIPFVDMNLLDAPLRGIGDLFSASKISAISDDPVFGVIRSAMRKFTSYSKMGYLLLPLGLGNHVDHLIVRDACFSLSVSFHKIYYEDLPYAARLTLEEIESKARLVDPSMKPHVFDIKDSLETKLSNVKLYHTQIGSKQIDNVVQHARRLSSTQSFAERLWYRSAEPESE